MPNTGRMVIQLRMPDYLDKILVIKPIWLISMLKEKEVENKVLMYENSNHAMDKDPETALQAKNIIVEYAERYL